MLQDSQKNKRQQSEESQPRQRRLTYVAGLEGRRYVNDKILRNLESSQCNSYGEYIAYATPDESSAYVPYDPFVGVDGSELLHDPQEHLGSADNAWDESAQPALGQDVSLNQSAVVNPDLEAALEKAKAARAVHATYQDLAKGAFTETTAYTDASQVQYAAHGYVEPPQPAESITPAAGRLTGEVHTTHYDGYQDPAYEAVFGSMAQQKQDQRNQQYLQPASRSGMTKPVSVKESGQYASVGPKDEYKKLLGGLFQGEAPPEQEAAPVSDYPDFPGTQQRQAPAPSANAEIQSGQQIQQLAQTYTHGQDSTPPPPPVRKPTRIPVKIERIKPPLPRQRNDEIYFEDNATSGKTSIFKMPSEGVVRSSRGTVELLVHKGGRMFRPHYNAVGILLRVDVSDGFSLVKGSTDRAHWQMTDREGNPLDEEEIVNVAFDKKGNLWYETVSGKKTKFLVTGGVDVTHPNQ